MKILMVGKGKMGQTFYSLYKDEITLIEKEDLLSINEKYDGVIDFSHPSVIDYTLKYCQKYHVPLVIGTTSYSTKQLQQIKLVSNEIPICLDSNYSLGILCLKKCIESLSSFSFEEIVITEIHHKYKLDSPSGTSLALKSFINKMFLNSVKIVSYREDDVFGFHKIEFKNNGETISLIHDAKNRNIFAKGARMALDYIKNKNNGLFNFGEIINGK